MLKRILAGLIVTVAMAGGAVAGPLDDAVSADLRGDYATAMRLYRQLADQGIAVAQNNLGWMYEEGNGVPMDFAEAAKWYQLSAAQGDSTAQARLCQMYIEGNGVTRDYVLAYMWCNLAAVQRRVTWCPGYGGRS